MNEEWTEGQKQDCERKACWRLMEKLGKELPKLKICLCADSLYAYERFFGECKKRDWRYILRNKEGSIPSIAGEYEKLGKQKKNKQTAALKDGEGWYDYVTDIDYNKHRINLKEYVESRGAGV